MKLTKRGERVKRIATVALWVFILVGGWYLAGVDSLWWSDQSLPVR